MLVRVFIVLLLLISAGLGNVSADDQSLCGVPPQIPTTSQSENSIKGDLEGKAQFLSSLVGKADLGGNVEATRKELYQNTDKFFAAQNDAYLAYMFCIIVTKDDSVSTADKLKALQEFRKPINSSAVEKPRSLQTLDGHVVIYKGLQGEQKSDASADIQLLASPATPSTLFVDTVDSLSPWSIVGADYNDGGLLRLFLKKSDFISSEMLNCRLPRRLQTGVGTRDDRRRFSNKDTTS